MGRGSVRECLFGRQAGIMGRGSVRECLFGRQAGIRQKEA